MFDHDALLPRRPRLTKQGQPLAEKETLGESEVQDRKTDQSLDQYDDHVKEKLEMLVWVVVSHNETERELRNV